MRTKKRRKSSRFRGTHTHGRGGKKKARGSGHRGGKGMAGTGKRADHRKSYVINLYGNEYFGKSKTLRRKKLKKLKVINIQQVIDELPLMLKAKQAHDVKGEIHVNLKGYKILSDVHSKIEKKLIVTASQASKSAIDKIKKVGGDIIIKK